MKTEKAPTKHRETHFALLRVRKKCRTKVSGTPDAIVRFFSFPIRFIFFNFFHFLFFFFLVNKFVGDPLDQPGKK